MGSRKAVYDEWKSGKSTASLALAFDRTEGQISELIIEYLLYLKALTFKWTKSERDALTKPSVAFNPPVRFLQTSGHKAKIGVDYDMDTLSISFHDAEAEKKYKHLISKLVVSPKKKGLKATSSYDAVFADYGASALSGSGAQGASAPNSGTGPAAGAMPASATSSTSANASVPLKTGALFAYTVTVSNALIQKLMEEARELNANKFPSCATFLLRNIVESVLKQIIDQQKANAASKPLSLDSAISLCLSNQVTLPPEDIKVLKAFNKSYVDYLNLGAHGNVIPNATMVFAARDCIDLFIKKNV